jgi:hypothetical protein
MNRVGYLYGTMIETENENKEKEGRINVDCIYEPPQECSEASFELLPDPNEVSIRFLQCFSCYLSYLKSPHDLQSNAHCMLL